MSEAKVSHDQELAFRNAYINDPNTASYFWALSRGGEVFLSEYGSCVCDATGEYHAEGHLNRIADWPGNFVRVEGDEPAFKATESFEPFTLVAEPKHLDHQNLSEHRIDVVPGDEVIWGHRVRAAYRQCDEAVHADPDAQCATCGSSGRVVKAEDTFVFGLRREGKTTVSTVYPDGSVFDHESVSDALAHVQ
jgi:hypothetical protein